MDPENLNGSEIPGEAAPGPTNDKPADSGVPPASETVNHTEIDAIVQMDDVEVVGAEVKPAEPANEKPVEKVSAEEKPQLDLSKPPKKGRSSYIFFCGARRKPLEQEQPSLSPKEVTAALGAEWRGMDSDAKAPFETQARDDAARYEAELAQYRDFFPDFNPRGAVKGKKKTEDAEPAKPAKKPASKASKASKVPPARTASAQKADIAKLVAQARARVRAAAVRQAADDADALAVEEARTGVPALASLEAETRRALAVYGQGSVPVGADRRLEQLWDDRAGGGVWNDCCERCGGDGDCVPCEYCNVVWHPHCLEPGLSSPPEGDPWACPECSMQIEAAAERKAERDAKKKFAAAKPKPKPKPKAKAKAKAAQKPKAVKRKTPAKMEMAESDASDDSEEAASGDSASESEASVAKRSRSARKTKGKKKEASKAIRKGREATLDSDSDERDSDSGSDGKKPSRFRRIHHGAKPSAKPRKDSPRKRDRADRRSRSRSPSSGRREDSRRREDRAPAKKRRRSPPRNARQSSTDSNRGIPGYRAGARQSAPVPPYMQRAGSGASTGRGGYPSQRQQQQHGMRSYGAPPRTGSARRPAPPRAEPRREGAPGRDAAPPYMRNASVPMRSVGSAAPYNPHRQPPPAASSAHNRAPGSRYQGAPPMPPRGAPPRVGHGPPPQQAPPQAVSATSAYPAAWGAGSHAGTLPTTEVAAAPGVGGGSGGGGGSAISQLQEMLGGSLTATAPTPAPAPAPAPTSEDQMQDLMNMLNGD